MGKAIYFLIFISLFTLIGMTGAQNFLSFTDDATAGLVTLRNSQENIIRTSVESVSATLLPGSRTFEVTLRNNGETKLADFALWDVTVQYYDYLNNNQVFWLTYNEGEPSDNQWTVKGIYLDATTETPELMEPGVLNPGEEIIIRGKLSPKAHHSNYGLAVIVTPNDVKTWNYFSLQSLYLHNYPTPPTENTTAQASLPMNLTAPTATVLYNYDTSYDSDPGRLIIQGAGSVYENGLDQYQNWLISATTMGGTGDTQEFDAVQGGETDIIHVSGDIYAIAYRGDGDDGFLKTVEISSAGAITDTVIDTLEFDTLNGWEPQIINIKGNTHAIAYRGDGDDGFLTTFAISSYGTISSGCEIDGDVDLTLWTGMVDFQQSSRGVVIAYLRDFDGSDYVEIASATLDAENWQGGTDTWVETPFTFYDVSYTITVGHYLEVKVVVDDDSDDDMWFAYDTTDYQSSILIP